MEEAVEQENYKHTKYFENFPRHVGVVNHIQV